MFQGPTTGVLEEKVVTIEVDWERVPQARKGTTVSIRLRNRVRKGDKVFTMVDLAELPPQVPRTEKRRRRKRRTESMPPADDGV